MINTCFKFLESSTEALAVKVFSMTVLSNFAKQYPEIVPEIKIVIEDQLLHQSAGFKSRAKKVLKDLDKRQLIFSPGKIL